MIVEIFLAGFIFVILLGFALMLVAMVCLVFDIFLDGLVSEKIQDLLERRE